MTGGQEGRGIMGVVARILCVHFVFTVHSQYIRAHQSHSYTYTLIAKPTQYEAGDRNIGYFMDNSRM